MGKGLNIVFWNVRSLSNKFDSIRHEVSELQSNVIHICETWLHDKITDSEINISNFNLVRSDRGQNPDGTITRGGGICTYIRQGIVFEEYTLLSCSNKDIEMLIIKLKLPFTRDIYMINVYTPPNGDIDVFIQTLQNAVIDIRRNTLNEIFIGGDLNIDILRPNSINSKKLKKIH